MLMTKSTQTVYDEYGDDYWDQFDDDDEDDCTIF